MSKKDCKMRTTIENILESSSSGQYLKNYFDNLPDKSIRRAISILSGIYPDKTTISDDDFSFIIFMFTDIKFMGQVNFSKFVRAINILNFTERQKKLLIDAIKSNMEILCDQCTFELDALLVSVFEPNELIQYLEVLAEEGSRPVLQRVFSILRYENFSNSSVLDEDIEVLKRKISKSINN